MEFRQIERDAWGLEIDFIVGAATEANEIAVKIDMPVADATLRGPRDEADAATHVGQVPLVNENRQHVCNQGGK